MNTKQILHSLPFAVSQVLKRCYFLYHRGQHIQYILNSNGVELNKVELRKTLLLLFYLFLDVIHEHCQLDVGLKREAPSIRIFVHQIQSVVASDIFPHVDRFKKNLKTQTNSIECPVKNKSHPQNTNATTPNALTTVPVQILVDK